LGECLLKRRGGRVGSVKLEVGESEGELSVKRFNCGRAHAAGVNKGRASD
jgi:hypothetical protein